ncbi:MAG: hypothetical protein U0573_12105 [Phycisphaerales bacterium]
MQPPCQPKSQPSLRAASATATEIVLSQYHIICGQSHYWMSSARRRVGSMLAGVGFVSVLPKEALTDTVAVVVLPLLAAWLVRVIIADADAFRFNQQLIAQTVRVLEPPAARWSLLADHPTPADRTVRACVDVAAVCGMAVAAWCASMLALGDHAHGTWFWVSITVVITSGLDVSLRYASYRRSMPPAGV